MDFPQKFEGQVRQHASALLEINADIGLLRLDLALRELLIRPRAGQVLVEIPWSSLIRTAFRKELGERLGSVKPALCKQIMLAVASVPSSVDEKKWSQAVASVRSKVAEVGLIMRRGRDGITAADMTAASDWPLSLLVIDASDAANATVDECAALVATATSRRVTVLVLPCTTADVGQWSRTGASLFGHVQSA